MPYEEAARLRFAYNLDWRYVTLTDGEGDPLKVYLTKGPHTLRLEAVLGDYGSLLDSLDGTVAALNDLYRQVIVITSVSPDKYQDYYLEREIPGLTDTLRQAARHPGGRVRLGTGRHRHRGGPGRYTQRLRGAAAQLSGEAGEHPSAAE